MFDCYGELISFCFIYSIVLILPPPLEGAVWMGEGSWVALTFVRSHGLFISIGEGCGL